MGDLVPIGLTEVLPGDTIQQATSAVIRVSPLLAPVMHPTHARIHHWFVPHRLVWEDWEDFITGGPDGLDASVFPTIQAPPGGAPEGSLADYLGVVPNVNGLTFSALPSRGYNLIWNEWYRDSDLQTELVIDKGSGVDTTTQQILQQVAWEKDYYTTARPWESKGPSITLPLASSAPVQRVSSAPTAWKAKIMGTNTDAANGTVSVNSGSLINGPSGLTLDPMGGLEANLANAAATLNEVREAFALQRYQEARARYGSRYTEYLRYLGIRSSDARLQRPEYLGGGKQTIQFSEVIQTGVTTDGDDTEGVGNLKGHGIGSMRSNRYRSFFEEHGYIFTFLSVKPTTMYANGLPRTWNKRTKEDFFQKELQFIGQQPIANKEVYAAAANPDDPFGYQDRYDEYRRGESQIAGEFRSTLSYWHYGRLFSSTPALNADFVKCVPTNRVYADTTSDQLQVMANHNIQARRIIAADAGESFIR